MCFIFVLGCGAGKEREIQRDEARGHSGVGLGGCLVDVVVLVCDDLCVAIVIEVVAVHFVCILLMYVYRFLNIMVVCQHSSCKVLGYAYFVSKVVGYARPIFVSKILG